jgi:hypothetical protein
MSYRKTITMNKLLFIIGIGFILCSCKKHNVEPAPQRDTNNTTVNSLPKTVVGDYRTMIFQYNSNNLVEKITISDSRYWPTLKDSTTFEYNVNNLVSKKTIYKSSVLFSQTYLTYTHNNNINQATIISSSDTTKYTYHYNTANEVDYFLTDVGDVSPDSTVINNDNTSTYYKNGVLPGEDLTYYHYYPSPNGIYTNQTVTCLNLSIDFQAEVTESFIQIGETDFPQRNYFTIPSPRKYCSFANNVTYTYTFDDQNRLIKVFGEFPNYAPSGSAIPGVISYEVYY